MSYLGGGNGPDLVVVRTHEKVGNTSTHHADNPLVEVLGLGVGNTGLKSSVNHAINALNLLLLGKHGDVVLEGVGDPFVQATNVRDTLVGEPVVLLGESLIDAVIEVLVVGEDNVATDIVQLFQGKKKLSDRGSPRGQIDNPKRTTRKQLTKPSGVTSVEARPPGVSLESIINQEGPFYTIELILFSCEVLALPLHQFTPYFFSANVCQRYQSRGEKRNKEKDLRSG